QLDFHFAKYPHGYYKFLEPCHNSKSYKRGQSWQEELGFSADEFRTAFDKIGVRYLSKSAFDAAPDKFQDKLYCSYFDKQQGLTYYFRNHPVVDAALDKLIDGGELPDENNGFGQDSTSPSTVDGDSQSTVDGQSPSTVNRQRRSTVDGNNHPCRWAIQISRDGDCQSLEMGNPHPPSLYSQESIKESIQESIQENTHTQNAEHAHSREGVCVISKSKFSQKECRRWAEHLHRTGQGITNPGGYAKTIHRTGEDDPQIEQFLTSQSQVEPSGATNHPVSSCPDCNGTGFWYPQGVRRGVARCKHRQLSEQSFQTPLSASGGSPSAT
ncbi:MAG: hypothetical protein M3458_05980, partial [Acidobacteriota bacterium]|nr:hypothetical protein [Acidobacteriota bacterium]